MTSLVRRHVRRHLDKCRPHKVAIRITWNFDTPTIQQDLPTFFRYSLDEAFYSLLGLRGDDWATAALSRQGMGW